MINLPPRVATNCAFRDPCVSSRAERPQTASGEDILSRELQLCSSSSLRVNLGASGAFKLSELLRLFFFILEQGVPGWGPARNSASQGSWTLLLGLSQKPEHKKNNTFSSAFERGFCFLLWLYMFFFYRNHFMRTRLDVSISCGGQTDCCCCLLPLS